ncbi:uncharacterized protein LOC120657245 [Panicum virgatum]|uniref:Zinc finger PHD-type domain-containing protein n=2 Tax=Panicum virgatum TaxID=38727 RepID=A0A8T0XF53_PANVG|nr:uncharacterized protein LOC120657245 [Panicum virgatum]KAG2654029.1 hypothetical protein PVAP13_1NG539300 [Panicum virgatum]
MKGGRLHRPEPPQNHLATAAAAAPAPNPADDWVDGSWTVDCSCGVTFDDGEEMVSCDECSVWVHTRCARYVRGVHTSFSCHKCRRSKRAPSSADEAEVAELLAELPTHRPPPLYRRWAEVPLPARVHVHGLPGGGDAALFRGAPAFSAALWRCAGYVPKRFGFRYCEFPSWADDNDGADALFALAREKPREMADAVLIDVEPKKEKHYVRSLSCRGKKVEGDQQAMPPLTEAKKRDRDSWKDGCQQSGACAMRDATREDRHAEANMASSDLQTVKTKKKMEESVELCGEKKSSEQVPGMLSKDDKKVPMKLEFLSGVRTKSSMAEQEVHSGFIGVEVTMHKQQSEGDHNGGLRSSITSSGSIKMQDKQDLQQQPNRTSNMQDVAGAPDSQIVQSKSQIMKTEPGSPENEKADCIQLASDNHESNKQGLGDAAGFSIGQRDSPKLTYDSVYRDHPKSESQNLMHTVVEHPSSTLGSAKVGTSFSGSVSIPRELSHTLASKEPPSAGNSDCSKKGELVSPTDSKHDSAKFSEDSSQDVRRCSEKIQLKGSLPPASKSSQVCRMHVSTVKPRLPVSKEHSHKIAITGGTSARSFHGEVPPPQSRNKAVASNSSQKKDKVYHRTINVAQESSNNSASTELRASDAAPLSDEQLALLLHQQLNSSPRVPRVPRCHQAAGTQMLHPTGASVFSKRSSAHGGRDHSAVLKKRNRDDSVKDSEDTKRIEKRHRDTSTERASSAKDSCRSAENVASEQKSRGVCSTGADTGLAKDDSTDSSASLNLLGLIDEIISKHRNISYGELCDAVHQRLRDSRKSSGGDCEYPSYLHAINDCLRKRREWAYLVDQASKMNSNKRRKGESNSLLADVLEVENVRNGPERDSEGSADLHQEDLPRGKRKSRKRRRLELKGRRVRDTRKRSSIGSSSEDAAATLSDSSNDNNDTLNQEDKSVAPEIDGYIEAKSADSSS